MTDRRFARALFSTGKDDHPTPQCVIDRLLKLGPIMLDPCSNPASIVPAIVRIMLPEYAHAAVNGRVIYGDGLAHPWPSGGLVYVNHPYSRGNPERWLRACAEHWQRERHRATGTEIVALTAARTDTVAWHTALESAHAVAYWRGRLRFLHARGPAPFPSALIYWGKRPETFGAAFEDCARIEYPRARPCPMAHSDGRCYYY